MAVQVHAQLAYVAFQHCGAILMFFLAAHAVVFVGPSLWVIAACSDHLSFVGAVEGTFSGPSLSAGYCVVWGCGVVGSPWCWRLHIGWQLGGGGQLVVCCCVCAAFCWAASHRYLRGCILHLFWVNSASSTRSMGMTH